MSYQVLARKWRPQSFSDVVGQQHVLTALANGLTLGRIHHAYLFSGTRGVGKTSIARLLAKGLNCESGITATPCGKCDNCREIEEGRFIDLLEIDAASRTKVEDTRDLLDNVQYAPARGRFKVYLIDEVHMLSRHSFNALLKTLEEPPPHVKFLLATTDPQKLPITILSRCLQFHLKALDVEQIQTQLEKVLSAEHIAAETRALQLLARAADGSMRDALSLTDQAIAMGDGQITSLSVSQMLGTLDDEQPLALIEALVSADGAAAMDQIGQAASRGVDWDSLLVETLALLHQIAMIQLLPGSLTGQPHNEQRLRELARAILPQDLQLYYQTLLVGRKELTFAPDRRMGVEMTFLRALAFHPKNVSQSTNIAVDESNPSATFVANSSQNSAPAKIDRIPARSHSPGIQSPPVMPLAEPNRAPAVKTAEHPVQNVAPEPVVDAALPDATAQLLQARTQLLRRQQSSQEQKKNEPLGQSRPRDAASPLERFANAAERNAKPVVAEKENAKKEAYQWKAQHLPEQQAEVIATPKLLRSALEHEKTPELIVKLAEESLLRDPWAAEIAELEMPKLVQQLALNSYKEQVSDRQICLHLRPAQRHLNTTNAQQVLTEVLSQRAGQPIELSIVEDDDLSLRTPLEWRQVIYEEKLAQAKKAIAEDNHIQTLCRFFDAELDEDSIRPV